MPRIATKKASGKTAKRSEKVLDPTQTSVKAVVSQLQKCSLDFSAQEILLLGAKLALPLEQENRTSMHHEVLSWVAAQLQEQERAAIGVVRKAADVLASIDADRQVLAKTLHEAQETRDAAQQTLASRREEADSSLAALDEQRAADSEGIEARARKLGDVAAVMKTLEGVQSVQAALREITGGTMDDKVVKKLISKVVSFLKKADGFDAALLLALPATLQKPIEGRSPFEQTAVQACVQWFDGRIGQLNAEVAAAKQGVAEAEVGLSKLVELERCHSGADLAEIDAVSALADATSAVAASETALAEFDAATESKRSDVAAAEEGLAEVKRSQEEFEKLRVRSAAVQAVSGVSDDGVHPDCFMAASAEDVVMSGA
jgi:hypothetical protein